MLISRILFANIKFNNFNKSKKLIFEDYSIINNDLFYHLYYEKNKLIKLNVNNKYIEIKNNKEHIINYQQIPTKILNDIDYYGFLNLNENNINNFDNKEILKNLINNLLNHQNQQLNQLAFDLIFNQNKNSINFNIKNLSILEQRHLDLIKILID